jgi:tRNA G18 (ribose-2'-O)-methylase SpoU
LISIEDPSDPRLSAYRDVRERDLVGRDGQFIAEGEVVLRHLIQSPRFKTVSVLLAQSRAGKLAPLMDGLDEGVPVYVASQVVMDAIAGFPLHRGVLAVGRRPTELDAETQLASLPADALLVAAVGIGNHDNLGGLFRNAAAFGADAVLLDATCCDPLYRKAIRVSVGAALLVPSIRLGPKQDLVGLLKRLKFEVLALSPGGSEILAEVVPPPRTAAVFGAEGPGLPADIIQACRTIRIPMAAGFDSLNVATAAAVVLHHFRCARPGGASHASHGFSCQQPGPLL